MCTNPIQILDKKTHTYKIASCRKCGECLQVRANEWALRGYFELQQYTENCFITLTYKNNPIRLHKEHMQNFIKRLRKKIDHKIKYFSCGEYGDQRLRPHYHIIIFGYDFPDKKFVRMSNSNKAIYQSNILDKLWPQGLATVQDANENTVKYSAKYSAKLKNNLPEHLKNYPEFNTMSHNLGIEPILKKIETYIKTDQIYMNGFSYKIPIIVLEKYFKEKVGLRDYLEEVQKYKEIHRNYTFRTEKQTKIAARLAKKKILHQKLREL